MPMTSMSSLRSATICCFSMARCTACRRSRRRAARSYSRSLAAARMSALRPADDLVGVAVEEVAQLVDQHPVVVLADLTDARAGALLDVEQQARPPEAVVLVVLARAAGADREAAQQQVERVADRVGVGVRTEVAGALALAAAHHQCPGELLVDRHGEERIALVVTQADVEARAVLLDQRPLEHQRLDLVAHLDPLHRLGGGDHLGGARVQAAWVLEVVRQPLAQARRLADVDHPAERVLELVRPGRVRDRAGGRAGDHRDRGYDRSRTGPLGSLASHARALPVLTPRAPPARRLVPDRHARRHHHGAVGPLRRRLDVRLRDLEGHSSRS